jgi:hypothetical protein
MTERFQADRERAANLSVNMAAPTDKGPPQPRAAEQPKPKPKKWSMALINLVLDATLFLSVVFLMWVSVMMQVIFPPPTEAKGWGLWGLNFDQWRDRQFIALCVAVILTVEHLSLHWNWVCCTIATHILGTKKPDEGSQVVYGVGVFIGILLLVMASLIAALFTVNQP